MENSLQLAPSLYRMRDEIFEPSKGVIYQRTKEIFHLQIFIIRNVANLSLEPDKELGNQLIRFTSELGKFKDFPSPR